MNDFKFVSEEYSKNNTHKYRLSIQINPDGFSVLMIGEENTILQIIHTQTNAIENTRKLFRSEENLINLRELTFKSFDLFINSPRCILLPAEEDIDIHPNLIAGLDFPMKEEDTLILRDLKTFGLRMVFVIPLSVKDFLSDFRNHPRIQHITSKFLNIVIPDEMEETAVIYTTPGLLHFSLKSSDTIKFHNIFECRNDEEIVFHLMNTLRTLDYPSSKSISYSGHLNKKSPYRKLLHSYLPGINELPNVLPFELSWDASESYFSYLLTDTSADHQW